MKTRQDAWTEENDLLLAETVLRHIREGSTQLNAFEEVGDKLNRTSAACGFRWNAVVRDQFDKEIQIAKKQRKQRQRALNQKTRPLYTPPEPTLDFDEVDEIIVQERVKATTMPKKQTINLTMDRVVDFLQNFDNNDSGSSKLKSENELLKKDIDNLSEENEKLLEKIKETEKEYESVQQDYQALVQIMDRARKMVLFEEQDTPTNTFKMDRNGNLERVAK
jgi:prespore-specific regulator